MNCVQPQVQQSIHILYNKIKQETQLVYSAKGTKWMEKSKSKIE